SSAEIGHLERRYLRELRLDAGPGSARRRDRHGAVARALDHRRRACRGGFWLHPSRRMYRSARPSERVETGLELSLLVGERGERLGDSRADELGDLRLELRRQLG